MDTEKMIVLPKELESMELETVISLSLENEEVGIIVLSELENDNHVLRLVHSIEVDDEKYDFIQELAAFSFQSRQELNDFVQSLPNLSGLEMLLLLNPLIG